MIEFSLNHVTVAKSGFVEFLDIAVAAGCSNIELRNDLQQPLFSGLTAQNAGQLARQKGLKIAAIAQLENFNSWDELRATRAKSLIQMACDSGAEGISLIPGNNLKRGELERDGQRWYDKLLTSMENLAPLLRKASLTGFVEPLGFETASLKHKASLVQAMEELGLQDTFKLVHDTFHHALAGERALFPEYTGIVHVSGVSDRRIKYENMQDEHRGFVNADDRLGNIQQLSALRKRGYDGPISLEVFSPEAHELENPVEDIKATISYINVSLAN